MRFAQAKLLLSLLLGTGLAVANDGAASTAAGGIQLVREPRIAMRTEKLTISRQKITVEYDFANDTDQDVTTEVAFPIPPYTFEFDDPAGPRGFNDLEAWVNDVPIKCQKTVKALVNGKDVTGELANLGVDADTFGHFDSLHEPDPQSPELARLAKADQQRLAESGVIDRETSFPLWTVNKTYYWQQTFPAHSTIHIRHQYQPVVGFREVQFAPQPPHGPKAVSSGSPKEWTMSKEDAELIAGACVTPELLDKLTSHARLDTGWTGASWIDYILTTANTWKTPIYDFRLILERPPDDDLGGKRRRWYMSFCEDAPVHRLDRDHFEVRVRNFVPQRELHIVFFADHYVPAK
jgi:hypothetical protein